MELLDTIPKYLKEKISDKDLSDSIHQACMSVMQTKNDKKPELFSQLSVVIPQIPDIIFNQFPRPLLHLAFCCSDRLIYAQLKSYDLKFSPQGDIKQGNNLAIYILGRVLTSENKYLLAYYLGERLENIKELDLKFVILEMFLVVLKELDNQHEMFNSILPTILRPLQDGMHNIIQFYLQNHLTDEKVGDPRGYHITFSNWILDYIKRIINDLKGLKKVKVPKGVVQITDMFQMNMEGKQFPSLASPGHLIKHYATLFMLDLLGKLNQLSQLSEQKLESVQKTQEFLIKSINDYLGEHPQIMCANYIQQKNFVKQNPQPNEDGEEDDIQNPNKVNKQETQIITKYSQYSSYNISAITYYLLKLLKSPQFVNVYSTQYLIQLALPIFIDFYDQHVVQLQVKIDLFDAVFDLFNKLPAKNECIYSRYSFNVDIVAFVHHVIVNFGTKTQTEILMVKLFTCVNQETQSLIICECQGIQNGNECIQSIFNKIFQLEKVAFKNIDIVTQWAQNTNQKLNSEELIKENTYLLKNLIGLLVQIMKKQEQEAIFQEDEKFSQLKNTLFRELSEKYLKHEASIGKEVQDKIVELRKNSDDQEHLEKFELIQKNMLQIKENLEFLIK